MKRLAVILSLLAGQATAQEAHEDFVANNLLAIFYHEFAHALVDVLQVPIFGQEEDAADVLSILLIDAFYEEDVATAVAYDTALLFWSDAEQTDKIAFWDTHGPDLQRFYTTVCLFYGANPDVREDVALELGLPEERIETCEDEFMLASDSWNAVLDEIADDQGGDSLQMADFKSDGAWDQLTYDVVSEEVAALNKEFVLPIPVTIRVEPCDEVNAFYDPSERAIIMCTEYAPSLAETAEQL